MPSKKDRKIQGAPIWIARLISFALIALILLIFGKVWLESILGCASMFENATYVDPDEKSRSPVQTPIPPLDQFGDWAYDMDFPDLIEPTPEAGEF